MVRSGWTRKGTETTPTGQESCPAGREASTVRVMRCGAYNRRPDTRGIMAYQLQTTIAGSLPKPRWLAQPNTLWAPWLLEGEALAEGKRDAVRLVLRDQEQAGIDI